MDYALVGNVANSFVVFGILFYNALTLLDSFGKIDLVKQGFGPFVFGEHWGQDGFCVSFQKEPLGGAVHSMLLCFYFGFIWAYMFYDLSKKTKSYRELCDVMQAKISETLFHGVGHGLLWLFSDYIGKESIASSLGTPTTIGIMIFYFFFFYSFVKNGTPSPLWAAILQCSVHALALVQIPSQLNFTYVNCVFLLNAALWPLFSKEKGILYALYATVVNVPILLCAWLEVLGCDALLFDWGDHFWFDASIPASHFFYAHYVMNYVPSDKNGQEESKPKAE